MNNNPRIATQLVEQAIVQAATDHKNNTSTTSVQVQNMRQMLVQQKKKVEPDNGIDTFSLGVIPPRQMTQHS